MNVLFEDEGQLKAGTVIADHDTSLQVEAVSGKRHKVKAAHVLLRFASPSAAEAIARGHELARTIDTGFLWEASADDEFGFDELARDYYGGAPAAPESASIALALAAHPMYFYRKGRGRYRKAPPDALKAALASVARKEREARDIEAWSAELAAGRLPDALTAKLDMLLHRPDRNAPEWKALAAASDAARVGPLAMLAASGAIPSSADFHFRRFELEAFPGGAAFPPWGSLPALPGLPVAPVAALSIDEAATTEIDDAFSVRSLDAGGFEIGIHIACPALSIAQDTALDAIARRRLSTVYLPGRKLTMLPDEAVDVFTLAAGRTPPALSLYVEIDASGAPVGQRTALERVPVAANLRLESIDESFTDPAAATSPVQRDLATLWRFASRLHEARGKADADRIDYSFVVDWDAQGAGERGRVTIVPRPRGSPVDRLVAELMIHVNHMWGRALAEAGYPAMYRVQSAGKVKMSTQAGEHQGLGLSHYLWASSPLRRYCDLVNQRQLIAWLRGEPPRYAANDAGFQAALVDFETTYSQYAEFQDRMEYYWTLRWLVQEGITEFTATVIRETLVRVDGLPLVLRLADASGAPGAKLRIAILRVDLLQPAIECRSLGPVAGSAAPATPMTAA
jgi:exoribonuclease-2